MFNKIANLYKAIINIFDDELTELFVILIILGIVAAIVLPSFLPKNTNNSDIENVEFVVDTLINDS